jgi:NADPH2:quinone reductase
VIGTVRRTSDIAKVDPAVVDSVVALDKPDAASQVRALAPNGVDRIVEVSLSENADFDAAVVANDAAIAAYASRADRPAIPFWPLLFANVTLRLLGSDDFSPAAKQQAAQDLTSSAASGAVQVEIAARYPLSKIACSHDAVDAGARGRLLLAIPEL